MDKLKSLETFVAVAEGRGFTAASRILNISVPSVTRIVNELETDLDVLLLQRTTRHTTLTDVGKQYLNEAKTILATVRHADEAARNAHDAPAGTLRILAPVTFGQLYITPIITNFLDRYPDVSVDAIFVDDVASLVDERIDVIVRIGELADSSFISSRVGKVRTHILGSPSYFETHSIPKTPNDILDHSTIEVTLKDFPADWKFSNGDAIRPKYRLSVNNILAAIEAARSGWGLVRLMSYQAEHEMNSGSLTPVLHDFAPPPVPIHILHGQGRRPSAKVRSFVDMAVKSLRGDSALH